MTTPLTVKNNQVNKFIKYGLFSVVIALLGYKSVYIEKLSARKVNNTESKFDAVAYTSKLWKEKMPATIDSAVDIGVLMQAINTNPSQAFDQHTHALAIGNYRYALVKATAVVADVSADEVKLNMTNGDSLISMTLATEFIYGNAIRDASGLIQVKDYPNSSDLNAISEGLNTIVRKQVLPAFKQTVKKGDKLSIVAAIELNKNHIHWQGLELQPLRVTIIP